MKRRSLAAAVLLTFASQVAAAEDSVSRLHALYDATHERILSEDPRLSTIIGGTRHNALWPNISLSALQKIASEDAAALVELDKIPIAGLSAPEIAHRELFRRWLQNEIDRIRSAMRVIVGQTGFHGSLSEFATKLRNDSNYRKLGADEMLHVLQAQASKPNPQLPRLFGKLPHTPFEIRTTTFSNTDPADAAHYQIPSFDQKRPGLLFVHLDKPEERRAYEIPALLIREGVPGHHLQMALAVENTDLPTFRRAFEASAFIEGWGLYAASLGDPLGLAVDPVDKFGQLGFEMLSALRMVADTGIHFKRWNREQAIALFKANTVMSDMEITAEVDRCVARPAQGTAPTLGLLKIRELRTAAEKQLGARFDVRAFHDAVLGDGPLPLDLLERNVKQWIQRQ